MTDPEVVKLVESLVEVMRGMADAQKAILGAIKRLDQRTQNPPIFLTLPETPKPHRRSHWFDRKVT